MMNQTRTPKAKGHQASASFRVALVGLMVTGMALWAGVAFARQQTNSQPTKQQTAPLPLLKPDFQLHTEKGPDAGVPELKPAPTKRVVPAPAPVVLEDADLRNQTLAKRNTQEPRLLIGALWSIFRPMWGPDEDEAIRRN